LNVIPTTAPPLLEVRNLKKYFRAKTSVRAVDDVSFVLGRGETLGLVGESGCGKTTTGRTILRLLEPTAGTVLFRPLEQAAAPVYSVFDLPQRRLRPLRRHMQMIFQDPFDSLNPRLTVATTLQEGLRAHGLLNRSARRQRVIELLERVGLDPSAAAKYPHAFSGGQRQRIGIARALIMDPAFIVCDEPVSALDVSVQAQIVNLLLDLQRERNLAYLFIGHDLAVVAHVSTRVAVMYQGQIVELAASLDLCRNPAHPYTRRLLQAASARGAMPEAPARTMRPTATEHIVSGCRYLCHCPEAISECRHIKPPLIQIGAQHQVRCHLFQGAHDSPEQESAGMGNSGQGTPRPS
jgi:oligopeptide transport system ATP-binding protein